MLKATLLVDEMTCTSCELRIEHELGALAGVLEVRASFANATVQVAYDPSLISLSQIIAVIQQLDYSVVSASHRRRVRASRSIGPKSNTQVLGIGMIALALYLIIKNTIGFNFIPELDQNMSYGLLFLVGLVTSIHCFAMCGGINLSQAVNHTAKEPGAGSAACFKPSFLYNAGRVLSYTIIGGTVGALGSVVSFSGAAQGIVAILSGIVMVIMGVNMLGIFPWLRRFNPRLPKLFGNRIHRSRGQYSPFLVGMLNGLMPCGPLQSMQIYALGTGSVVAGALSMFFFSLGTVPLMFGFGVLSSSLGGRLTHRLTKVSAALVLLLGLVMFSRGLNLSGGGLPRSTAGSALAVVSGDAQLVTTDLASGRYESLTVQAGILVKWTIQATADTLNGCNEELTIPEYGISKQLIPGANVILFTPEATGNVTYTCWMGMISGTIRVVEDVTQVSADDLARVPPFGSSRSLQGADCFEPSQSSGRMTSVLAELS